MGRPATVVGAGLVLSLLLMPVLARAQWMWKDDQGHTIVSDQGPPSSVPNSRILRSPSGTQSFSPPASGSEDNASDASKDTQDKTAAEKEMDFQKRQKDAADAARKQQELAKKQQQVAQLCTNLRANLNMLQSGIRVARMDAQGERYIMDDTQRSAEMARAQNEISQNCK